MADLVTYFGSCFMFAGHVSTPVSRHRSIRFSLYSTESHFDRTMKPAFTNSTDIQTPGNKNNVFVK